MVCPKAKSAKETEINLQLQPLIMKRLRIVNDDCSVVKLKPSKYNVLYSANTTRIKFKVI